MAQCTAHTKSGPRCKQPSIPGGQVCRYHGGAAPQVRNAAAVRLAAAADPAVSRLIRAMRSKSEGIALRATQDILDRTNMKGENLIRMLNPDAGGQPFKLTEEQIARVEKLKPDELAILCRVLGLIAEPGPVAAPSPPLLSA